MKCFRKEKGGHWFRLLSHPSPTQAMCAVTFHVSRDAAWLGAMDFRLGAIEVEIARLKAHQPLGRA